MVDVKRIHKMSHKVMGTVFGEKRSKDLTAISYK